VPLELFEPSAGEPDVAIASGSLTAVRIAAGGTQLDVATPPAGRRVRVLSVNAAYNFSTPPVNQDCPTELDFREKTTLATVVLLALDHTTRSVTVDFQYDLPTDEILKLIASGLWADVGLSYSVRYRFV
jgi:hypothetical protein